MSISRPVRSFLQVVFASALNAQSVSVQPQFSLVKSGEEAEPIYSVAVRASGTSFHTSYGLEPTAPSGPNSDSGPEKKPCALGLAFNEDENIVSVDARLHFDDCASLARRHSQSERFTHAIGKYALHLHEAVVLEEMKRFGVEPYTIRVVDSRDVNAHARPRVISKVPALQIAIAGEEHQFFKVAVRNLSCQAVTGFIVARSSQDGRNTATVYGDRQPMIASGADYEVFELSFIIARSSNTATFSPHIFLV